MKIAEAEHYFGGLPVLAGFSSSLSIIMSLIIMVHYNYTPADHKSLNRLYSYASFGNLFGAVATSIGRGFMTNPSSSACQVQALVIQWLLPTNSLFIFFLAICVSLTIQRRWTEEEIRNFETYCVIMSYGLPLLPAFFYLYMETDKQGRMYGDAISWCWLKDSWDVVKIAAFYGSIWLFITATITLNIVSGIPVVRNWLVLREIAKSRAPLSLIEAPVVPKKEGPTLLGKMQKVIGRFFNFRKKSRQDRYTRMPNRVDRRPASINESPLAVPSPAFLRGFQRFQSLAPAFLRRRRRQPDIDFKARAAVLAYTRSALIQMFSMFLTWGLGSANDIYRFTHPGEVNLVLLYFSALVIPLQGFWNGIVYILSNQESFGEISRFIASGDWVVLTKLWFRSKIESIRRWGDAWDRLSFAFRMELDGQQHYEQELISRRLSVRGPVGGVVVGGDSMINLVDQLGGGNS